MLETPREAARALLIRRLVDVYNLRENIATTAVDQVHAGEANPYHHLVIAEAKAIAAEALRYASPTQQHLLITPRQVQIIAGMARGHSNTRIAAHLGISAESVHTHIHRISRRVGKASGPSRRAGIVGYAYRTGILAALAPEPRPPLLGLTARLLQILDSMAHGLSDAEIGRKLHLSPYTVKRHAQRLYSGLDATCRPHAVALGYQHGLLQEPSQLRETA